MGYLLSGYRAHRHSLARIDICRMSPPRKRDEMRKRRGPVAFVSKIQAMQDLAFGIMP